MASTIIRYNATWNTSTSPLDIEMTCIRKGGKWTNTKGVPCGEGLPFHFQKMREILWPNLDDHRWHQLTRNEILKNKVTVLMGPGSSGKTHAPSWIYLCEYYCFPEETLVMVSSTDMRGLRLRVWGEINSLHEKAKEQFDWLSGHLIDSKMAICSDNLEEDKARDLRKGIIGIPCIQNGKFVGLGKFLGIKQKRIRLIADEAQFMGQSFLSAFSNLDKNEDFKATILGNPNDPLDPLGKAAEPLEGWTSHMEPTKTEVWKTRFMGGTCVNLIGTDSPNFDYPEDQPTRFKYLISREKIKNTLSFFSKDSIEYYSQCVGAMKIGVLARRVLTRDLCTQFHALHDVTWKGTPLTYIAGLDAAYGGDRCVCGYVSFGQDINGTMVINIHPPAIVPIRIIPNEGPEDQIATWVKKFCEQHGIPPENFFHDATGRGSLGTALARVWSAQTNPIDFGGAATNRPVSLDMFIIDPKTKQRRLKLCNEHYVNFVTELWYSVRYVVEAGQMRNLPEEVMEEMCMREWEKKKADRIQVETKDKMKERVGRSPDLGDWLSICVEGSRRRGFQVAKLAKDDGPSTNLDWLDKLREKSGKLRENKQLTYS